jgi:hypothetical protein
MRIARLGLAALAVAAVPPAGASPHLTVPDTSPIVVRGTGFERAETVRLTVRFGTRLLSARRVASATGVFVVRFKTSLPRTCPTLRLSAVGSAGSHATARIQVDDCGGGPPSG